jgi:hypothetical protein
MRWLFRPLRRQMGKSHQIGITRGGIDHEEINGLVEAGSHRLERRQRHGADIAGAPINV